MLLGLVAVVTIATLPQPASADSRKPSHPSKKGKHTSTYVHRPDEGYAGRGRQPKAEGEPAIIEVFKDSDAWFGENRDHETLLALGKIPGVDYFIHPMSELVDGISPDTDVVLLPSNGWGLESSRLAQNDPSAQANLASFVSRGGVLIIDMGDNDSVGGYHAPGAIGTPALTFPTPQDDATLTRAAAGLDGQLGTSDDHPTVLGADQTAGTGDDLDDQVIDACCYVAHGNLSDGITLPPSATVLMTATFDGVQRPILAEYCWSGGRVILDTVTKEFESHTPTGRGPSMFMSALFSYALNRPAHVGCQLGGLRDSVRRILAGDTMMHSLDRKLQAVARVINTRPVVSACGKLKAFENEVRAQRGKRIAPPLADEWTAVSHRIRTAVGCH
jgi:hypothetical protein